MKKVFFLLVMAVVLLPVVLLAQDTPQDPTLDDIAILLQFQLGSLLGLGFVVTCFTEGVKKLTKDRETGISKLEGWKILFVVIPACAVLSAYLYIGEGILKACVGFVLLFAIASGGWEVVKGAAKKSGEGFASAMTKLNGKNGG